jgi:hypothetical protein
MEVSPARWLVLIWRLPTGSSTARVSIWRKLRRLGAAGLTPGAAILPFRDDLQEQLDWLAQEVEDEGGEGWVLPVTELSEVEERAIREQMICDRQAEYESLKDEALEFLRRAAEHPFPHDAHELRLRTEKELLALQRRFRKIVMRDYCGAAGRRETATTIDRCLAFRQGISGKLMAVTDPQPVGVR